jgi:glucosamine-6-phosphate deaminase
MAYIHAEARSACIEAAALIARAIEDRSGKAVLGLATGATPIAVYEELVSLHRAAKLSFQHVFTFNLDEYYPISPLDPRGYRHYMHEHLFQHIDIPANQAHLLDGTVPEPFAAEHGAAFDHWIDAAGGLDLQLLGIGKNGHIGFNEPSDLSPDAFAVLPTRLVNLHPITKANAASEFGGDESLVPTRALTLGTRAILAARRILVLAFGAGKSEIVRQAVLGPITAEVPASLLQRAAAKTTWFLDQDSAAGILDALG